MYDFSTNDLDLPSDQVIDRAVYYDPEVFAAEMARVFRKTWQFAGHEAELRATGDFITVDVADQSIIVTRGKDGTLNAFFNNCTHRGTALTMQRKGNTRNAFRCMYHAWCFDLTGKLTAVPRPAHYGKDFDRSKYNAPRVRVESFAGLVFVCLDEAGPTLATYLGDVAPQIEQLSGGWESLGRLSFLVDGNWKLWAENFRDGYHPEYTHPLVGEYYRDVALSAGTIEALNRGHSRLWWPFEGNPANIVGRKAALLGEAGAAFDSPGTRARPPFEPNFAQGNVILCVFPNLDVQNLMGDAEHVIQVARPLTPDRTRIDLWVLGRSGEPPEARLFRQRKSLDAQASSGKVSGDDCEAAARITKAIRADAVRHTPLSRGETDAAKGQKTEDHAIRGFYAMWRDYMGGAAV